MEAETLIRPVIEGSGLELVDVAFRRESGRRVLRVVVDREGGVDVDTIAELAEKVSRRLDVEGFAPGPYALEVSSPGIERSLKLPRDFARRVGDNVKVKTTTPVEGRTNITGELVRPTTTASWSPPPAESCASVTPISRRPGRSSIGMRNE